MDYENTCIYFISFKAHTVSHWILVFIIAHLIAHRVDVDPAFFLHLRQMKLWSSYQQEVSAPI